MQKAFGMLQELSSTPLSAFYHSFYDHFLKRLAKET